MATKIRSIDDVPGKWRKLPAESAVTALRFEARFDGPIDPNLLAYAMGDHPLAGRLRQLQGRAALFRRMSADAILIVENRRSWLVDDGGRCLTEDQINLHIAGAERDLDYYRRCLASVEEEAEQIAGELEVAMMQIAAE